MPRRPNSATIVAAFHSVATTMEHLGVRESYHAVCLGAAAHLGCSYHLVHKTCLMEDLPDEGAEPDRIIVIVRGAGQ